MIKEQISYQEKPFLGICVGHQVLSTFGTEINETHGMDIIPGQTVEIEYSPGFPIPHIGWSEVSIKKSSRLFDGIDDGSTFYFVHSFYTRVDDSSMISSTVTYNQELTASVEKENIYGVQFHPEKSQENGLRLLKNFSCIE